MIILTLIAYMFTGAFLNGLMAPEADFGLAELVRWVFFWPFIITSTIGAFFGA